MRKLHEEYKRTSAAFDKHIKKNNCTLDMSGCTDRAKYQERLATLDWAVLLLGGRPNGAMGDGETTIGDFPAKGRKP